MPTNNIINIFYNGGDSIIPSDNSWENFGNPDSLRTFLTCAESWKRHGWEVRRLHTWGIPQKFYGRLKKQEWYPQSYLTFCQAAMEICRNEQIEHGFRWHYFGTYDVFNYGVTPAELSEPVYAPMDEGCVSFQRDHFSMSFFKCNSTWINNAIRLLNKYDLGELPEIPRKYVSDETILRHFADYAIRPIQAFPLGAEYGTHRLVHFARSSLNRAFHEYPAIP